MEKKVSNIIVNFFDANPEFQNAYVETCVTIIFEWTKDLLSLQGIFYHLLSRRCHVGQWTKTQATISAYLLLKSVFVAWMQFSQTSEHDIYLNKYNNFYLKHTETKLTVKSTGCVTPSKIVCH